jgi:hypothetical protein
MYGFEYQPGFDGAVSELCLLVMVRSLTWRQYITWMAQDVVAWTMKQAMLAADPATQISERPVPLEPMVRASPRANVSANIMSVLDREPGPI